MVCMTIPQIRKGSYVLFSGTKERMLNSCVISAFLHGSECRTNSSWMKMRHEATEIWFDTRMLIIPWTEHVSNQEAFWKMETKMILIFRKKQLKFLRHILKKYIKGT